MSEDSGSEHNGAADKLERRYRRLLRCYPSGHRAVHQEEMLGVLLAAARPGQRSPDLALTVNLVACGLGIQARRALGWLAAQLGQDSLAVVSLIAPVLLAVVAILNFATQVLFVYGLTTMWAGVPFWQSINMIFLGPSAAVMTCWLAVVVLGLTGRRRTAAVMACVAVAPTLLALLSGFLTLSPAGSGGLLLSEFTGGPVAPAFMASLAACSLTFSAGPRRGLEILGRWRAYTFLTALSVAFGFPAATLLLPAPQPAISIVSLSILGMLAITVVVTRVRAAVTWRVTVLLAAGLLLNAAGSPFAFSLTGIALSGLVVWLGNLLLSVLVWPVVITSWRGQASRSAAR
jgi:hypothetical protein